MPFDVGSSLAQRDGATASYEVSTRSLRSLMGEAGLDEIDLLKVDVEGAEWDVLTSIAGLRINAIVAEIHLDLLTVSLEHIEAALGDYHLTIRSTDHPERYALTGLRRSGPDSTGRAPMGP